MARWRYPPGGISSAVAKGHGAAARGLGAGASEGHPHLAMAMPATFGRPCRSLGRCRGSCPLPRRGCGSLRQTTGPLSARGAVDSTLLLHRPISRRPSSRRLGVSSLRTTLGVGRAHSQPGRRGYSSQLILFPPWTAKNQPRRALVLLLLHEAEYTSTAASRCLGSPHRYKPSGGPGSRAPARGSCPSPCCRRSLHTVKQRQPPYPRRSTTRKELPSIPWTALHRRRT